MFILAYLHRHLQQHKSNTPFCNRNDAGSNPAVHMTISWNKNGIEFPPQHSLHVEVRIYMHATCMYDRNIYISPGWIEYSP